MTTAITLAQASFTAEISAGVVGVVLVSLGFVSILFGRIGRRIDDHPVCRKCSFDQTGKPESSTRCAECGADLTRSRAIRIGNRERNALKIRAGWVCLAVAVCVLSWAGVRIFSQIDTIRWAPLSWILDDADAASPQTRVRAHNELIRRINSRELSKSQQTQLVDRMLKTHGDPLATWTGWEPVLDRCLLSGYMSNEHLERFLRQWFDPKLQFKPTVRRGQGIVLDLHVGSDRGTSLIRVRSKWEAGPLLVGGVELANQVASSETSGPDESLHTSSYSTSIDPEWSRLADILDGPHELALNIRSDIVITSPNAAGTFKLDIPLRQKITLLPRDATVDQFVVEDARRQAIQDALNRARVEEEDGKVMLGVYVNAPPMPIAMDIFLVRAEERQRIGVLRIPAGTKPSWKRIHTNAKPRFRDGAVDVVLVPSQAAADRTLKLDTYWGEQIVIRDVRVGAPHTAAFLNDESLRPQVESCIRLDKVVVRGGDNPSVSMSLNLRGPPVKVAYRLFIRAKGQEQRMNRMDFTVAANQSSGYGFSDRWSGAFPDVSVVDVILRPDDQWEFRGEDQVPPWAGEVILKDVPVERARDDLPLHIGFSCPTMLRMASKPVKRLEYDIIEPIGKRVVVRKDDNKRTTKGGIVLPDTHEIPVITGRVIAISKAIENDQDQTIRQYDKVLFDPREAIPVELEHDNKLFVVHIDRVLAIFRRSDQTKAASGSKQSESNDDV